MPEVISSFRLGRPANIARGKRRALAHRADDLEILQRAGRGLRDRNGWLKTVTSTRSETLDQSATAERHIEIVVEDCTAQPRHGRSVGGDDDGAETAAGEALWSRAIGARKRHAAERWQAAVLTRRKGVRSSSIGLVRRHAVWRARPGRGRACSAVPAGRGRSPAKNWRQKARNSARGLARPSRLSAGEERDAEVIVAMTRPAVFLAALPRESPFVALTVLA